MFGNHRICPTGRMQNHQNTAAYCNLSDDTINETRSRSLSFLLGLASGALPRTCLLRHRRRPRQFVCIIIVDVQGDSFGPRPNNPGHCTSLLDGGLCGLPCGISLVLSITRKLEWIASLSSRLFSDGGRLLAMEAVSRLAGDHVATLLPVSTMVWL